MSIYCYVIIVWGVVLNEPDATIDSVCKHHIDAVKRAQSIYRRVARMNKTRFKSVRTEHLNPDEYMAWQERKRVNKYPEMLLAPDEPPHMEWREQDNRVSIHRIQFFAHEETTNV